jgi:hypothetical protein
MDMHIWVNFMLFFGAMRATGSYMRDITPVSCTSPAEESLLVQNGVGFAQAAALEHAMTQTAGFAAQMWAEWLYKLILC